MEEKGGEGFPHLAFLDEKGDVILSYDGERDVAGFREAGDRVRRFLAARRGAAEKPGVPSLIELLAAESAIREIPDPEILNRVAALGTLSEEDRRRVDPVLMDVEMRRIIRTIVPGGQVTSMDPAKRYFKFKGAGLKKGTPDWEKAARECLAFWRAGRRPAAERNLVMFLVLAAEAAETQKELDEARGILRELQAVSDDDMVRTLNAWHDRLEAGGE